MSNEFAQAPSTSDRKTYQREYCKTRYSTDPEFRARKLERNRQRYQRRTTDCQRCGGSIQTKTLIKAEDTSSPICRKCYASEHPKTMGRPRRMPLED